MSASTSALLLHFCWEPRESRETVFSPLICNVYFGLTRFPVGDLVLGKTGNLGTCINASGAELSASEDW